jgi:hypothetical protein
MYRTAWNAKLKLVGHQNLVGWNQLLDEHVVGMEDLQDSERKKTKAPKGKRKKATERFLAGENPVPGAREKNRELAWIWTAATEGELTGDKTLYAGKSSYTFTKVRLWSGIIAKVEIIQLPQLLQKLPDRESMTLANVMILIQCSRSPN